MGKVAGDLIIKGADISNYVEITYHISEAKYNALPQYIKELVTPARIIKLGKPIYKLTKLDYPHVERITPNQFMSELGVSYE